MTIAEIREKLPEMCIWMAATAVKEGVSSYRKAQVIKEEEESKKKDGKDFDFLLAHAYTSGMDAAAQVLWKVFSCCVADCKNAIEIVGRNKDGYFGSPDSYFDSFVEALQVARGYPVELRINE